MLPFRTELRNSPKEQTIKIYIKDASIDTNIMKILSKLDEIRLVEVQQSVAKDRVSKNVTIYGEDDVDINELKTKVDNLLNKYFV